MAKTTTVQLSGFRELERALSELPKVTGKNVLRRVAKAALEPMADTAAGNAPTRSGRLAFSIMVSEKRTRRAKKPSTARYTSGGFRSSPTTSIEIAMGPASGFGAALKYASFDEFGTVDTPAFAYMRGAWASGSARSLEYIKDSLGDVIQTAARKVAVKRAKAG